MAEKVIFVDGPVAGTIRPVRDDWTGYMVSVPRPLRLGIGGPDTSLLDETAYYSISSTYRYDYAEAGVQIAFRVASANGSQVDQAAVAEHAPTGLAEQGLIPWSAVPDTTTDRNSPIEILEVGDPLKDCKVRISDPFHLPTDTIEGSCGCGWRTDYQIPMARRAQVVRAAHKHAAGQDERRERYAIPIRVLDEGSGPTDTCLAGFDVDKVSGLVSAHCRECGWRTEKVEQYRGKPLGVLRATHIGADGVRHARNRLLTAFGLPAPTLEEEEAMRRG